MAKVLRWQDYKDLHIISIESWLTEIIRISFCDFINYIYPISAENQPTHDSAVLWLQMISNLLVLLFPSLNFTLYF